MQAVQKSNGVQFVLTRSRQALHFHLAPFRNRTQIVTAKVTFSNIFAPAWCKRDFSVPFSNHSGVV
jgi:hypothetical protein